MTMNTQHAEQVSRAVRSAGVPTPRTHPAKPREGDSDQVSTGGTTGRSVLTSRDGGVEMLHSDRDHVSVRLPASESVAQDVRTDSRLLCAAVTHQRAHHARHVQIAVDGAEPSGGIHLEALRARIGIDVQSMTLRRAGSSVMVDLHLTPPAI